MITHLRLRRPFIIVLVLYVLTAPTIWAEAPSTPSNQEATISYCRQRPLPDLTNITTQPASQTEPLLTIPATDPQLELLRQATFLLGEGDRLNVAGEIEAAREKWLAAADIFRQIDNWEGESDANIRLATSYSPLAGLDLESLVEGTLDIEAVLAAMLGSDALLTTLSNPENLGKSLDYYEKAFTVSVEAYETLIQEELEYDQALLTEAEMLYGQGRDLYEAGNCQEAQPLLQEARALFQEAEFGSGELRVLMIMFRCQFNPADPFTFFNSLTTLFEALWIAENLPLGTPTTQLYLEGVDLFEQGRWAEAGEALSEAQAQYEAAGETIAAAHAKQDLAGAYAAAGDLQQAQMLYEAVLAFYETTPDEYNLYNQAGVHHNLGNIATLTGRYQAAVAHYNTAVDLWRAIGQPAQEVASLTGLGWVLREAGNYNQALAVFEEAQTIQKRLSPDPETEGDLLNNIALVYISLVRYDQALELLNQALVLRRQLPHPQKELETLNNIATVQTHLGQFASALQTYDEVLAIANEAAASRIIASTQVNIANVHIQQGRYQQGLAIYLEILPVYQEQENAEEPAIALIEADIGAAYRALGDLDNAQKYLGTALEKFDRIGQLESAANIRNNLGLVALQAGDLPEAQTCLEQTLTIWHALDNPAAAGAALANLAALATAQGDFTTAVSQAEEALALIQQSGRRADEARVRLLLGVGYLGLEDTGIAKTYGQQVVALANNLDDPALTVAGQVLLATAYYAEGEQPLAYEHSQQAIGALEQLQGIITVAELKASFLGQLADAYTLAVLLAVDLGRDEEAFYHAEQARARAFLDQISNGSVDFRAQADADLLAQESDLQAQIAARRQQLTALHNSVTGEAEEKGETDAEIAAVKEELAQLEAAHKNLLVELKVSTPDAAAWLRPEVASLSEVQSNLDDQTTLVEYYVSDEKSLAFVIARDEFTVVELPDATRENLQKAVVIELSDGTAVALSDWLSQNTQNPHPLLLRNLHAWLVAPLAPHLNTTLVGLIPHQLLHYVPFAALTDGETYFGQQHTLFVLPSASSLGVIQENAANRTTAVHPAFIVGNPTVEDSRLLPLPHAAAEATAVADLFGVPAYTGANAPEIRFWSDVQGAGIIHLAAHGSYNVANPLYSAIHLSPGAGDTGGSLGREDGRLEVHELYDLDLKTTEMVVLSACQTNVAEANLANQVISAGDEIVGLTRAFFAAGTPTVISSLWNVNDAATEELMVLFYGHWQSGMGKAEALQMAQRDLQATYPSPFYWAGFVLSGDPDHVVSETPETPPTPAVTENTSTTMPPPPTPTPEPERNGRSSIFFYLIFILIVLLLIGVVLWYRRRRT